MRVAITNFTGGEVAPSLSARYDLGRYKNSLQCMENFIPSVHGNAERRPGTHFIDSIGSGDAIILPFSFSIEAIHNFIIVLTDETLQIATADGILSTSLDTPWDVEDLINISYAQVGDVVYFTHKDYAMRKLLRSGSFPNYTWTFSTVNLNSSIATPGTPTAVFSGGGTGYTLRYKVVAVDSNGKESLPSAAGTVDGKHVSDWVVGNYVTISWTAVSGASEYNVYREEAGYYGFIGISAGTSFVDNNYEADISDTPRENWNPFASGNHPNVVSFHQQRMVLAGTKDNPQAFYMSRVGDFENFRKSRPIQEDDPVEYSIASGNIDTVAWVASFGDLLIGTSGSEYKASGGGDAITVSNISITAQSYWGSSNLPPIIIGNSIMHVQRHGARVRDLYYSLEKDGYAGNDLSIMAPHLFEGHSLRQWCFQQAPYSTIWIVRDDGVLLSLTYMKEHDIWGWSRHITQGKVRSVATIAGESGDDVYMVVEREAGSIIEYYLERLGNRWQESDGIAEAFYMDSGITQSTTSATNVVDGLEHLEGLEVAVLADGSPIEGLEVYDGGITLPYAAKVIHVGLPYTSTLSPLPVEGDLQTGTSLGLMRGIGQCIIRMLSSVGGKYGTSLNELYDFPFVPSKWGKAVDPFSGDIQFTAGGGQESNTSLWIVQDRPLPFTVGALVMDVDISG